VKQECKLSSVWSIWIAIPFVALVAAATRGWWIALFVATVGVLFQIGYVRNFRHVSRWLGYGSVEDVRPSHHLTIKSLPRVTLYTAAGCPFCPIVRQRLHELQQELFFELDEQDVTFRPQTLRDRGIRSVPVVEVAGRQLIGNQTSDALAAFLAAGTLKAAS
jgi:glutaredoxin